MQKDAEIFISVDIEASGPIPGEYSMLSLGACRIDRPDHTFSITFQPICQNFVPDAIKVSGLSLETLKHEGAEPKAGMQRFSDWILEQCSSGETPVFVGFNAPFDWSFVNYYFHRFIGHNPFGFTALDIKAYFMGKTECSWRDTRSSVVSEKVKPSLIGDHNALHDALYQAELFQLIRKLGPSK